VSDLGTLTPLRTIHIDAPIPIIRPSAVNKPVVASPVEVPNTAVVGVGVGFAVLITVGVGVEVGLLVGVGVLVI